MLEGLLEVGDVGLVAGGLEELSPGEDLGPEARDVGLEGAAGDGDDVLAEEDAYGLVWGRGGGRKKKRERKKG